MKFIVTVPGLFLSPKVIEPWHAEMTAADIVRYAQRVDELGYDYIRVPEHLLVPRELSKSMGTKWTEPVTTMAFLAGATSRVHFVTGILVLPYHNPVVLAKGIATLDYLSGGRVTLGVGVGHVKKEFAALDIPFHERGAIGTEYIRAIKELWTSDDPSFDGRFVRFKEVIFDPKPVQKPHPPIWVGGLSEAALRRAADMGGLATPGEQTARGAGLEAGLSPEATRLPAAHPALRHRHAESDSRRDAVRSAGGQGRVGTTFRGAP